MAVPTYADAYQAIDALTQLAKTHQEDLPLVSLPTDIQRRITCIINRFLEPNVATKPAAELGTIQPSDITKLKKLPWTQALKDIIDNMDHNYRRKSDFERWGDSA